MPPHFVATAAIDTTGGLDAAGIAAVLDEHPDDLLVTIPHVQLFTTGTWQASTGPVTFTVEDVASAKAALDDPLIQRPRVKLGHVSPINDAEPTLGVIANLSIEDEGQSLFGDLVGVPRWLAEIAPTAYPNRSIEGTFGYSTRGGTTHRFVLEAVALLGVVPQAVESLADLRVWFSKEGPLAGRSESVHAASDGKTVSAGMDMDDVRRAYYESLTGAESWWWIRSMYLDPNELIVDDGEGALMRVPFTISGTGVTFGDPVKVRIQYVDVAARRVMAAAAAVARPNPEMVWADRASSRPDTEEPDMDVRELLGLPADATDEQVEKAKTAAQAAAQASLTPANPAPNTPADDGSGDGDEKDPAKPSALNLPPGVVVIDADQLAALQAGVQVAASLRKKESERERDDAISAALGVGKFPPTAVDRYRQAWDQNPAETRALLDMLPEGVVPVNASATVGASVNASATEYPPEWLTPQERARLQAINEGRPLGAVQTD